MRSSTKKHPGASTIAVVLEYFPQDRVPGSFIFSLENALPLSTETSDIANNIRDHVVAWLVTQLMEASLERGSRGSWEAGLD
jgi:hypothetical protein